MYLTDTDKSGDGILQLQGGGGGYEVNIAGTMYVMGMVEQGGSGASFNVLDGGTVFIGNIGALMPTLITYLAVAVLFSAGDMENALSTLNITGETASAALPSIQATAAFDYGMMAMNVIERLFAMLLHIGLTVVE